MIEKTLSETMVEPGGPVGPFELKLIELVRAAEQEWGKQRATVPFEAPELKRLGEACASLAQAALRALHEGDRPSATMRALNAATIEGMVFNRAGAYNRLYEVLSHGA